MKDLESNLEKLNKTVFFIKNMLLDADKKPELSRAEKEWVEELKDVIYEADDLFDEVITVAKQNELNDQGANLSKRVLNKVNRFFSSKNRVLVSYKTCQEVKSIQLKLAAIARNHDSYDFVDPQPTLKRREETCSFLNEQENIIGREDDVKAIVDMIIDPNYKNIEENVGFVAIVGVGGLGKTTLARLVYNHHMVKSKFDKNMWVCVSDQDGNVFDVYAILGKILESATNRKHDDVSTMELLHKRLRGELENKKFLLILDDLWTEDPLKWGRLRDYLTIGGRGSKVVVTTHSEKTAEVILGKYTNSNKYMLSGLSDDNSWRLFESTAFERDSDQTNDAKLVGIGKKIVKKCFNVPLAIKVVGTLLYGQTHKWESFEKKRLPEIETANNPVMSILKLSYDNLEPAVKDCFCYCALFPKDYAMFNQNLISLWMAQGYTDEYDSENCFSILLKRCFFQELEKANCGDVIKVKIHDLLHDLAQEVNDRMFTSCFLMRVNAQKNHSVKEAFVHVICITTLRLRVDSESLPESIGKLVHLRCLDLSYSWKLKKLPNSITELYNLQTLILISCGLEEWPKNFCKLVNLRMLNIQGCTKLKYMPSGIGQLANLRDLREYRVSSVGSSGKQSAGLEDLKSLTHLTGGISIMIDEHEDLASKDTSGECSFLEKTQNLNCVMIYLPAKYNEFVYEISTPNNEDIARDEAVLVKLKPHRNLKHLLLFSYHGAEIPKWGRAVDDWGTILPNLVLIELGKCHQLHSLPLLRTLKHLKSLYLQELHNLEYMESNGICSAASPFFPSLEVLSIVNCTRLKGWWKGVGGGDSSSSLPAFPRLCTLTIRSCSEFISLPPCPNLESMEVTCANRALRIIIGEDTGNLDIKLKVITIDNVGYLTTLPVTHLTSIVITNDQNVKSLAEIEDVFKSCRSSLRSLTIDGCGNLTGFSRGMEHLTALESLHLARIPRVDDEDDSGMPWKSLHHNLLSMTLESIDDMEILPQGIKYLTSLQDLTIEGCCKLTGLPEWISCLSSLHSLEIRRCPDIKSLPGAIQNLPFLHNLFTMDCPDLSISCQEPSGQDWPKIQHIPYYWSGSCPNPDH
ncbi:hypothetical protein RND81_09G160100 [Saponaria officinalis]|uniref:Uncharacterized protein n=1 Tax=Saponaria officinalis TaxID=3572 RepID=A0AAW1IMN6_SAPOF